MQLAAYCQAVIRQSSGTFQAVIRQLPVFARQLLGSLYAVLRPLSGRCYHVVFRQMSVRFVIYWAAYGSERLISLFLQCMKDFMWNFSSKPSSIYSWFLKPLSVLHSRFPTKKSWVLAYFFNFFQLFQKKRNYKRHFM